MEQTPAWRQSGDLTLYPVVEIEKEVYVDIGQDGLKKVT
jgi:hypothetical protein